MPRANLKQISVYVSEEQKRILDKAGAYFQEGTSAMLVRTGLAEARRQGFPVSKEDLRRIEALAGAQRAVHPARKNRWDATAVKQAVEVELGAAQHVAEEALGRTPVDADGIAAILGAREGLRLVYAILEEYEQGLLTSDVAERLLLRIILQLSADRFQSSSALPRPYSLYRRGEEDVLSRVVDIIDAQAA